MNIPLKNEDIDKCYRLKSYKNPKNEKATDSVLVSFNSLKSKEAFMKNRKNKFFSNDIITDPSAISRIYINENLTSTDKLLFKEVRDFRKEKILSIYGQIMVIY